jgi:SAM-dependent methyltransferase
MPRVDYDLIAHLYDEPIREHVADERLFAYLKERPDLDEAALRILDVGCGTGRQLAANRTRLPRALMVGVDRFRGMLQIAAPRSPGIGWVQGDGAHLPLASASFDYATNQFSYQHIAEQEQFIHEMHRVLRPGGRFVMANIDPWSMPDWSIYQFFPEAFDLDSDDFLPPDAFAASMRAAGFMNVAIEGMTRLREEPLADFLAYASERHRASQLMAISDDAYDAGLQRIRAALAEAGSTPATVNSGVSLVVISGDRPAVDAGS